MLKPLLQRAKRFTKRFAASRQQENSQRAWESRWSAHDFDPSWRVQTIPPALQESVDQQWFPPHGALLDIGCGRGECANWLAQQGFQVLGIDFAPSAIACARRAYPEHTRLQFQVVDICQAGPGRTFAALFDRGCLHVIPHHLRAHYVQQVATVAVPGARFLLLHKLIGSNQQSPLSPTEQTERNEVTFTQIQRDFQAHFEITNRKLITFPCQSQAPPAHHVPGLAVWLVRR